MTRLPRLEGAHERMDEPDLDPAVLARTLTHLETVNRWFGGFAGVFEAIGPLLKTGRTATVLDIGCGGGDVPRAIAGLAGRHRVPTRIVGVERHAQTIAIALERSMSTGIDFVRADGLALPFADDSFDIVMMSLTLHHFDGARRAAVLREMARVARRRVLISDLERCWPNYAGARLFAATIWRRDSLARDDGPVSVLRAFTPAELAADLGNAGLNDVVVKRRFFYRLIASGSPRTSAATASTL